MAGVRDRIRLTTTPPDGLYLDASKERLQLVSPQYRQPFQLDLPRPRPQETENLLRACGPAQTVLDAFAGFGQDGLLLAGRYDVVMVESHPWVFLLLNELLHCHAYDLDLRLGDAMEHMLNHTGLYDVIYLDPMFPERTKKALPNRGMQHLRELSGSGNGPAVEAIVAQALNAARHRVVLKRRVKDPVIGSPNHQIKGKTVRFDVYLA